MLAWKHQNYKITVPTPISKDKKFKVLLLSGDIFETNFLFNFYLFTLWYIYTLI